MFLSFYSYLQDNNNYLLSNLILNQIQTLKKRMSLVMILFLIHDEINIDLSICIREAT